MVDHWAAAHILCSRLLERIQPRIDAWLRVAVGALEDEIEGGPVGEGPT